MSTVTCPICGSKEHTHYLTSKDFTTTGESFHVKHCAGCGLYLTEPRPSETESARYYKSPDYISHAKGSTGLFDSIYLIIRYFTVRSKFQLIKKYNNGHTLLDVGCGTGAFLKYCNKRLRAAGVEPSNDARAICKQQGLHVESNLPSFSSHTFDIITLWHVLEHLYDLPMTLTFLKDHLADNGTIFIAVPNHESLDAQFYRQDWAGYDVPRHLWHFSKSTMTKLAAQYHLQIKAIHPMKLDAFYVALLSEKYRRGRHTLSGVFQAFWIGLKSNLAARPNQNYSSLIYILQK